MKVPTKEKAWEEVNKIFPTDYEKDHDASKRAGYDIYRHPNLNYYNRICDLGNRLEVLTDEFGDIVTNIWIAPEAAASEAGNPAYGKTLAEEIKEKYGADFSKITHFDQFVLNRGWEFKTEEALRVAYDRAWKCSRDILITENEFIAEAGLGINTFSQWSEDAAREVYNTLAGLVQAGKLTAAEVYRYAHYKWCLRKPEAIIAYQAEGNKWIVNNCATKTSEDEAKVAINSEWGFEVSRIKIIGTAYYDATDYQFIRFDCARMTWLWNNGNLYQVYA